MSSNEKDELLLKLRKIDNAVIKKLMKNGKEKG